MFWALCTPAPMPAGQEERIQDIHLDESVGPHMSAPTLRSAPTLMQSRPIVQIHLPLKAELPHFCGQAAGCIGLDGPGSVADRTEMGLAMLKRIADAELGGGGAGARPSPDEVITRCEAFAAPSPLPSAPEAPASPGALPLSARFIVAKKAAAREPQEADRDEEEEETAEEEQEESDEQAAQEDSESFEREGSEVGEGAEVAEADEEEPPQYSAEAHESGDDAVAEKEATPLRPLVLQEKDLANCDDEEELAAEVRARQERLALQLSCNAREERESRERARAFLIQHGHRHVRAKSNRRTLAKTFPLHRAVWCNNVEMLRLLLRLGADPSQRNSWGQTPLEYAVQRNDKLGNLGVTMQALKAAEAEAARTKAFH